MSRMFRVESEKVRRPKFYPKRIKSSGLIKDKHASEIYLRKLAEFKKKRRFHKFISIGPIFLKGRSRKAFDAIVDSLEDFRIQLGLSASIFYRLASEFILIPSGRKYYPLRMIFVEEENQASEEFITRLEETLTWISDLTSRDFNNDRIVKVILDFSRELEKRKISADRVSFKSKDWYCLVAIQEVGKKKGWSEVELLERIRIFYRRKIKKVTVEMVLGDLTHGELDKLDLETNHYKKKRKVKSYVDVIKDDPGYQEWKEEIPD